VIFRTTLDVVFGKTGSAVTVEIDAVLVPSDGVVTPEPLRADITSFPSLTNVWCASIDEGS
jgi:hypothetical protein